jgi:hypothetical protein
MNKKEDKRVITNPVESWSDADCVEFELCRKTAEKGDVVASKALEIATRPKPRREFDIKEGDPVLVWDEDDELWKVDTFKRVSGGKYPFEILYDDVNQVALLTPETLKYHNTAEEIPGAWTAEDLED